MSDSDIEILEEVSQSNGIGSQQRTNVWDEIEELLDQSPFVSTYETNEKVTDATSQYHRNRSTDLKKDSKNLTSEKNGKSTRKAGKSTQGDSDFSVRSTDDEDVESLLSISPPESPKDSRIQMDFVNSDHNLEVGMGLGVRTDENFGVGRGSNSSDSGSDHWNSKATKAKSPKKNCFKDKGSQEFDDFFQGVGYSSLADYLEQAQAGGNKTSQSSSYSSGAYTSNSSTSVNSKTNTEKGNSKSKPVSSTPCLDEEEITRLNKKSKRKTSDAAGSKKGKGKENNISPVKKTTLSNHQLLSSPVKVKTKTTDARKMIMLYMSETILSDQLAAKLIEMEIRFQSVMTPVISESVLFEHNVPYKVVEKDMQVHEKVIKEMDENVIIIFPIEKYLDILQKEVQQFENVASDSHNSYCLTLTEWVRNIQTKHGGKKFTLLVQGLEAYLRKLQRVAQKEYRDRVLNNDQPQPPENEKKKRTKTKQNNMINLTRNDIQSAFIGLQLHTKVNCRFYENASELATHLNHYSKAIAEAPMKKEKEQMRCQDFDWSTVADASGGIPVEKDGKSLSSLWISQLCKFPKVGQERALAISKIYPGPRDLYKAYRRCSREEGQKLLADIQITVGVGPLAKKQKLGPEASRRVYIFFTARDGDRDIN